MTPYSYMARAVARKSAARGAARHRRTSRLAVFRRKGGVSLPILTIPNSLNKAKKSVDVAEVEVVVVAASTETAEEAMEEVAEETEVASVEEDVEETEMASVEVVDATESAVP